MRAATTVGDQAFRIGDVEDPVTGPGELVLRVTGCGVCGSDLSARPALPDGTVMGHELSGEVTAVGDGVTGWAEGDQAAVLPVRSCGTCPSCADGHVAHCDEVALIGLGGAAGGFAELVSVPAAHAFRLPDTVPAEWGPLVEPFAVGLHTATVAEIAAGDRVLIVGGGAVGLTTARWAAALGAASITVADPAPGRRASAASFGATAVVDPTTDGLGGPYDVVVDAAGRPGLLDAMAGAAANHGRIVIAGVCIHPDTYLPLVPMMKELTISFAVYYSPEEFRTVVDAFATGRIDPSPLRTRTAGLDDLADIFATHATPSTDLKVVVDPSR